MNDSLIQAEAEARRSSSYGISPDVWSNICARANAGHEPSKRHVDRINRDFGGVDGFNQTVLGLRSSQPSTQVLLGA